MLKEQWKDTRGTVASINAMVQEVDDFSRDGKISINNGEDVLSINYVLVSLGFAKPSLGLSVALPLSVELQDTLVEFYNDVYPEANVCARASRHTRDSNPLVSIAKFHSYLIKDGRRITPLDSAIKAPNSIIQMEFGRQLFAGQILSIIQHRQFHIENPAILVHVRWFRRDEEVDMKEWDP